MDGNFLHPVAAAGTKLKQKQKAKEVQAGIQDTAHRKGVEPPDYDLEELIGKGSFGMVFKSKNRKTNEVVAVKIMDVDSPDYEAKREAKDDSIKDFIKEITVLRQLKDSKAQNVNIIYEAFSFASQLWIVSEYCPGGSVHTLMKATPKQGLEEEFIVPIARELAIALRYVHDAGIIHRDIKCANILITEDGRLQLCDFGIAGILENEVAKRSTIIGTPNWMPPELMAQMFKANAPPVSYGTEVDCWAYGCAVFEMATGIPPHARIHPQLLATVAQKAPRLEGGSYSAPLRDFVSFCLEERPQDRPNASQILQHAYIANTSKRYPTESLRQLIDRYARWEQSGGQRQSLFAAYGAVGPEALLPPGEQDEDWNFSTTVEFDRQFADIHRLSDPFNDASAIASTETAKMETSLSGSRELTPLEQVVEESKIRRGKRAMERIFNVESGPYTYGEGGRRISDLPLRNMGSGEAGDRTTMIDLDAAEPILADIPTIDLDVPTLRAHRGTRSFFKDLGDEEEADHEQDYTAKRATRDWKMPTMDAHPMDNPNRRTQDWTFPKMVDLSTDEESARDSPQRRRRMPRDLRLSLRNSDSYRKRRTQDWTFPKGDYEDGSSADEGPILRSTAEMTSIPRPQLRHATTMPVGDFNDLYTSSRTESPTRISMIDLDDAIPSELTRPSTANSTTTSAFTDITSGDPFELEDQVHGMTSDKRTSFHTKSRSEPTAHTYHDSVGSDDREYGSDQGPSPTRAFNNNNHHHHNNNSAMAFPHAIQSDLQRHWARKRREHRFEDSDSYFGPGDTTDDEYYREQWGAASADESESEQHRLILTGTTAASSRVVSRGRIVSDLPVPVGPRPEVLVANADKGMTASEVKRLARDFTRHLQFSKQFFGYGEEVSESEGA